MTNDIIHEHEERPLTKKARSNPWMISTIVLAIFALILIIGSFSGIGLTGNVISEEEAGKIILDFAEQQTGEQLELVGITEEAGLYEVIVLYQEQEVPLYLTKDGKNLVQGITPLSTLQPISQEDLTPMMECAESYGITNNTIIFYYSDSCGWCARMKPGVEELEKQGYEFKWIEAGENSELLNECISPYFTSGGVPKFVCPKKDEVKVGAFADSEGNLDIDAMKSWVDSCISN